MSIMYKVCEQKLKTNQGKQTIYVARALSNGETTIEHLQKLIAKISAVSEGDVRSVLMTLTQLLATELAAGRRVSLGELGRMRIGLKSRAVTQQGDFDVQNIRRAKVTFTPGALIKSELRVASYQRYTPTPSGSGAPTGSSTVTPSTGQSGTPSGGSHAGV